MPVLIWAGGAALAAAEKKPAETVTLENQLLLGKTFSYSRIPKSKDKLRQNPNFHRRPVLATFTSMTVLNIYFPLKAHNF
jgi:hypothetical protein